MPYISGVLAMLISPAYYIAAIRARADANAALIIDDAKRNSGNDGNIVNSGNDIASDIAAAEYALESTKYPYGLSVTIDHPNMNLVYKAITGSELQRAVMKVKFYACIRIFSILYGRSIDMQQPYGCRIWYHNDAGVATHTDIAKRGSDWYDSDGNVLQKWNGMHLHNVGGLMIARGPKIFRVNGQSAERYDMWALYPPWPPAYTGVATVPIEDSPESTGGDKKRQAIDI